MRRIREVRAAAAAGNPSVEPAHILQALLRQEEGIALALRLFGNIFGGVARCVLERVVVVQ